MKNKKVVKPPIITSKRFMSERNAKDFASKVNGTFQDLRHHVERKSDFKVTYEKKSNSDHYDNRGWDFDSELNGNGTYWHTADDL